MKDLFGEEVFPESGRAFDGATYEPKRDYVRLKGQMLRVFEIMKDGRWHTLSELSTKVEGSEAGVSARLRDLRKSRFGSRQIERDHVSHGLFRYRMVLQDGPAIAD